MSELKKTLNALRRPKLLVRAARMGVMHYRRDRDLGQVLRQKGGGGSPVKALVEAEERLETTRQEGDSTYSIQRHVGVLTALIAEARLAGFVQTA